MSGFGSEVAQSAADVRGGDSDVVVVPERLARRIRLALDHAHRDAAGSPDSYHALADELVALPDYPTWKEPWGE